MTQIQAIQKIKALVEKYNCGEDQNSFIAKYSRGEVSEEDYQLMIKLRNEGYSHGEWPEDFQEYIMKYIEIRSHFYKHLLVAVDENGNEEIMNLEPYEELK